MTGDWRLDWAAVSVSLFNTLLMVWLGLTVWLNAARRTAGVWLTSLSLFGGALFFVSHTAIVGQRLEARPGLDFWWQVGLWAVAGLPLAWYSVVLWHTGFWNPQPSALRPRHRWPFVGAGLALLGIGLLLMRANPLPTFSQAIALDFSPAWNVRGLPVLVLVYPVFSVFCLGCALDALLRPGPAARPEGERARRRARPWLVVATLLLLVVSLGVAAVLGGLVVAIGTGRAALLDRDLLVGIGVVDVVIATLLALTMLVIGQAMMAYEVFTGQSLPRQGLQRYWHRAGMLAAGLAVVIGGALAAGLRPLYVIVLTALGATVFYAVLSWRAYTERERAIRQLRPFVVSDHQMAHGLWDTEAPAAQRVFATLCREVLGVRRAVLMAVGPLGPLVTAPLAFAAPGQPPATAPDLARGLAAPAPSPQTISVPLEPAEAAGFHWAVPLWSERGLIGWLYLDEKENGGLFAQEELEIARATGERLVDQAASAELLRRLASLQRERLAESRVVDQRVRRELHDEVLPRLHAAILQLSASGLAPDQLTPLTQVHRQIADLLRAMPTAPAPELARLGLFGALRHLVAGELAGAFDNVHWAIAAEAEAAAQRYPPFVVETAFYAVREGVRNAARYGRGDRPGRSLTLRLEATARPELQIVVEDDGVGFAAAGSPVGGARQGLVLHSTLLAVVGGTLAIESRPALATRLIVTLPLPSTPLPTPSP